MSERFPPATRDDHDTFCEAARWSLVRGATGRPVQHHRTYELTLWDGRILRTRISQPVDGSEYASSLWSHILREQLAVTNVEFWACVRERALPDRGEPELAPPRQSVPLYLYRELQAFGLADIEILDLDAAGAAERLAALYRARETD